MNKIYKIYEYGYLILAIVFLVETFLKWSAEREKAYLMLFFSVLALGMYFFKRRFRSKVQNRNKE